MRTIYTFAVLFFSVLVSIDHMQAQCFPDQNFTTTGSYNYIIPGTMYDTFIVEIECIGADGAPSLLNGTMPNQGGSGASMTAQFELTGGTELTAFVGQAGQIGGSPAGGGGAGGTAVIRNFSRAIIAAAGGGGAGLGGANGIGGGGSANINSPPQGGGAPGAAGGGGFNEAGENGVNSNGGGAGTLTSIGAGGMNGGVAGLGGNGWGGGGGGAGTVGGGGGGHQGGDGGSMNIQGGLGGDSYINTNHSINIVATVPGVNGGASQSEGSVLISCISHTGGFAPLYVMIDSVSNPECNGMTTGSIGVSADGGSPPYEYAIDGVNFSTNNVFTGLGAGFYTLTVKDVNGTIATETTTLIDPSSVSATIVGMVDNICFSDTTGSIEVAGTGGTGGYSYSIDGTNFQSSGLFENLSTGTYTISILDALGCAGSINATVGSANELVVVTNVEDADCHSLMTGSILIDVSGGVSPYEYSVDGINFQPSNSFTWLGAGGYIVTVRDAIGCLAEELATIGQPDSLFLDAMGANAGCGSQGGGSIIATAAGGSPPYLFTINDSISMSTGIFENLAAGTYNVEVMDIHGCMADSIIIIDSTSSDPLVVTVIETGNLICFGDMNGWINVEANGGTAPYMYSLDTATNSNGLFNNLGADIHEIEVIDSTGCSQTIQVELTQPDQLMVNIDTIINVRCEMDTNGVAIFSVNGGVSPFSFILNDTVVSTDGIFSNLAPRRHSIKVIDANMCSRRRFFTISVTNFLEIFNYDMVEVACFGESTGSATVVIWGNPGDIDVVINGDTTIAMDGDTLTFNNLSAGNYPVTVIDESGCTATNTVNVSQPSELILSIMIFTPPTDSTDAEITLTATGGRPLYEYSIDTGATFQSSPTFSNLSFGNYQFMVRDTNDCLDTIEYIISSIADVEYLNGQIELFPNPTSDLIEFKFAKSIEIHRLSIYDQLGRLTYSEEVQDSPNRQARLTLNCANYLPGIYYAKIQTNSGMAFKQFVVMHE